jgi:GTPase SAR1 family protein
MVKLIFNPSDKVEQRDAKEVNLNPFKNVMNEINTLKEDFLATKDIVGLENFHYILKEWYYNSEKNVKGLLVMGPVGCGKTTMVSSFCKEENIQLYNVIYSENTKTKKDILRELLCFCEYSSSFFIKSTIKKLILIDEYQNNTNDIFSIADILNLINIQSLSQKERSSFLGCSFSGAFPPIVIISSDPRGSKLNELKKVNEICYINEIPPSVLKQFIKSYNVLEKEANEILKKCKSDKRQIITTVTYNIVSQKDIESNVFDSMEVFFESEISVEDMYKIYETDGFTLANLVHENYLSYNNDIHVIAECSEAISYGETVFSDTFESSKLFIPESHFVNSIYIPTVYLKSDKPNKNIRSSCINNRYNIYLNNKKIINRINLNVIEILFIKKIMNYQFVKTKVLSVHQKSFLRNVLGTLENNIERLELIYKHFSEFKETGDSKSKNFTIKFKEKLNELLHE